MRCVFMQYYMYYYMHACICIVYIRRQYENEMAAQQRQAKTLAARNILYTIHTRICIFRILRLHTRTCEHLYPLPLPALASHIYSIGYCIVFNLKAFEVSPSHALSLSLSPVLALHLSGPLAYSHINHMLINRCFVRLSACLLFVFCFFLFVPLPFCSMCFAIRNSGANRRSPCVLWYIVEQTGPWSNVQKRVNCNFVKNFEICESACISGIYIILYVYII